MCVCTASRLLFLLPSKEVVFIKRPADRIADCGWKPRKDHPLHRSYLSQLPRVCAWGMDALLAGLISHRLGRPSKPTAPAKKPQSIIAQPAVIKVPSPSPTASTEVRGNKHRKAGINPPSPTVRPIPVIQPQTPGSTDVKSRRTQAIRSSSCRLGGIECWSTGEKKKQPQAFIPRWGVRGVHRPSYTVHRIRAWQGTSPPASPCPDGVRLIYVAQPQYREAARKRARSAHVERSEALRGCFLPLHNTVYPCATGAGCIFGAGSIWGAR